MPIICRLAPLACLIGLQILSGCGENRNVSVVILPRVDTVPVSLQDKKAAQALSIGNAGIGELPRNAYQQALACREVAETLTLRLQAAGALESQQSRALNMVRAHFDRLSRKLAPTHEAAAVSASSTAKPGGNTDVDPSSQARMLMACAQRMQDG